MEYVIQPGDTLFAIAQRFGITLQRLLAANPEITNPSLIFPGQRITIPVPAPPPVPTVYVVQPGDTLFLIAQRFGITLAQLLAANPQITDPSRIFPGQRINIPAPTPPPATTVYIVQPGDTLSRIAARFGTTVANLLRLNPGITDPNLIFPGQRIIVPAPAPAPPGCLVFVSTRSGRGEVWRSDTQEANLLQLTRPPGTPEQPVTSPRWSPNGRFIAYLSGRGLYIMDPCGNFLRLADDAASYAWSNDSTRIAFSNEGGTFITDLTGRTQLLAADLFNPDWFPGDRRLAGFTQLEDVRFPVLAVVDADGTNFRVIEPLAPAALVRISPNGRYAQTVVAQGFAFGFFSTVFVHDFQIGTTAQLPGFEFEERPGVVRDVSFIGGWAPDSSRLVYTTLIAANGQGEVRIATPQGSVTQTFRRNFYPRADWGPLADWVVLTLSARPGESVFTETTPRDIFVLNVQTGREIRVTSLGDNYEPDWSPQPCPPCG